MVAYLLFRMRDEEEDVADVPIYAAFLDAPKNLSMDKDPLIESKPLPSSLYRKEHSIKGQHVSEH